MWYELNTWSLKAEGRTVLYAFVDSQPKDHCECDVNSSTFLSNLYRTWFKYYNDEIVNKQDPIGSHGNPAG